MYVKNIHCWGLFTTVWWFIILQVSISNIDIITHRLLSSKKVLVTWFKIKKELNGRAGETAFLFTLFFFLLCFMTAFLIWVLLSKESGSTQATLCRGLLLCFHSVDNGLLYWEDSSLLSFAALAATSATQLSCYHLPPWALTLYFASCGAVLFVNAHVFILFNEMLKIIYLGIFF